MLKERKLGNQGLKVSALGLGCMGMSFGFDDSGVDAADSVATIHHVLDLGLNFLDTAEMYGPYTNEELIGHALKGRRSAAVIATKFGRDIQGRHVHGQVDGA